MHECWCVGFLIARNISLLHDWKFPFYCDHTELRSSDAQNLKEGMGSISQANNFAGSVNRPEQGKSYSWDNKAEQSFKYSEIQ